MFASVDFAELFAFTVSPIELVVRGTALYWFLYLIFRFVLRRGPGSVGIGDTLLLVLIADAAQNGMSADYKSISEAAVLVSTLVFWSWLVDWSSSRFPAIERLAAAKPLQLVRDGKMNRRNMRTEYVTVQELMSEMRSQGVDDLGDVKAAYMEPDGSVSVIKHEEHGARQERRVTHSTSPDEG